MSEFVKPKIEELAEELEFWNAFRQVYLSKGIDGARICLDWATKVEKELNSPGGREEFAELCKAGCLPQGLAALITLLRYSPFLETYWTEMVGQPDNRAKSARALEEAVHTLETLYSGILSQGLETENECFTKIRRILFHASSMSFEFTLDSLILRRG